MNPFGDRLPEESESQYEELTTMLQQAYSRPISVASNRQAQILAQVRGRLGITDAESVVREHGSDLAPFRAPHPAEMPRPHRLSRLVMLFAAVLVMGAFVMTGLLLFQSRTPSTETHPMVAPPIDPLGTPVTIHAQAGGLDATMRVTPGPYFLSEMLEVDLSVTNHSHDTFYQFGNRIQKACTPSFPALLTVMLTGGGRPSDADLQRNMAAFGCGSFVGAPRPFSPGQTLTFSTDIVLTNSGHITLAAQVGVIKIKQVPGQNNTFHFLPNSDPLAGHWPSLQINVQARVPSDRLITGQQRGGHVTIDAPPLARSQLFYASKIVCDFSSIFNREKLTTMTLQQPLCDNETQTHPVNRFVKWTYAVGAPGYAVFSGSTQR